MKQMTSENTSWLPVLLVLSLLVPVFFFLGPVRLTPYRLILVVMIIPLMLRLFSSGKPVYAFDFLFIFSFLWSALSLSVVHGFGQTIETSAIYIIEGLGAYLVTRILIDNKQSFYVFVKIFYFSVLFLLPFAIFEAATGKPIILDVLRKVLPVPGSVSMNKRFGLERAQVVFEHSILFGVYCSSVFGLVFYVLIKPGSSAVTGLMKLVLVTFTSFLSVSTGAVLAINFQLFLIAWDKITAMMKLPRRWLILGGGFAVLYVLIDILSTRSPFHVFVNYLAFSSRSAYNRILIWQFGTETVWSAPVFGIGFGTWLGPAWMGDSVDNFWLLLVMRYGLPGGIAFIAAIYLIMKKLGSCDFKDPDLDNYRKGYLVSLGGMLLAGATVHYWNATYVLFMAMIGSGVWMLSAKDQDQTTTDQEVVPKRIGFTRAARPAAAYREKVEPVLESSMEDKPRPDSRNAMPVLKTSARDRPSERQRPNLPYTRRG